MESVKHYITDMDGVLVKGLQIIPGADRFIRFPYRPTWVLESVAEVEL